MLFIRQNIKKFEILILPILIFNAFLINDLSLSLFDQCLNFLLSIGVFEYFKNNKFNFNKQYIFDTFLSGFILIFTLYRSFWSYALNDKFIFFVLPLLLLSFLILNFTSRDLFSHFKVILISFILPIKEILFIPLSTLLIPLSTIFTWFFLNIFGFEAYTKGQEIFIGDGGVKITYSCSGSEQVIFTFASILLLNFLVPFKKKNIFVIQILIACLITFLINVFRLWILAVFVDTYQLEEGFSIFDFLHGSKGSLLFTLISTLINCDIYKKLYSLNKLNY